MRRGRGSNSRTGFLRPASLANWSLHQLGYPSIIFTSPLCLPLSSPARIRTLIRASVVLDSIQLNYRTRCCCGRWIRTTDLQLMRLSRYHFSTPHVMYVFVFVPICTYLYLFVPICTPGRNRTYSFLILSQTRLPISPQGHLICQLKSGSLANLKPSALIYS